MHDSPLGSSQIVLQKNKDRLSDGQFNFSSVSSKNRVRKHDKIFSCTKIRIFWEAFFVISNPYLNTDNAKTWKIRNVAFLCRRHHNYHHVPGRPLLGCLNNPSCKNNLWMDVSLINFMYISPLLANPGKLIQKFFRNFSVPGRDTDRFQENSSIIFLWVSFCKISEHGLQRFGWFFQKSVCVMEFFEYRFSTECSILDEFSTNRSSSCPGNLPIRVKGPWRRGRCRPTEPWFTPINPHSCLHSCKIQHWPRKVERWKSYSRIENSLMKKWTKTVASRNCNF